MPWTMDKGGKSKAMSRALATLRDVRRMNCAESGATPAPLVERPATLEERLWASWRSAPRPKPATKELREAIAFFKKAADPLAKAARSGDRTMPLRAIDCCGGHGVLAMLMVAYRKCDEAVVIDLMQPASFANLRAAWSRDGLLGTAGLASVEFVQDDISNALPAELARAASSSRSTAATAATTAAPLRRRRLVVMACHACQFLTTEIVEMCCDAALFGSSNCVPVAVMSCCPKDEDGGRLKSAAKALGVPLGAAADLVLFGRMLERGLTCRVKTIDKSISPMNRILLVTPGDPAGAAEVRRHLRDSARRRLAGAYVAAHADGLRRGQPAERV